MRLDGIILIDRMTTEWKITIMIMIAIESAQCSTDVLVSKTASGLHSMPVTYPSASYFSHPLEMLLNLLFLQGGCVPSCGITDK